MANCPGCNLPLIDGQAMNGLLKCHWDCQEATKKALGEENAAAIVQSNINTRLAQDGITKGHHLFEKLGGS